MKIELHETSCTVTREPGDKPYYGVVNAAGESKLLYAIKNQLNQQGYDFIKKHMWKDGHLVDDMQQYLIERKPIGDRRLAIWNTQWAIDGAEKDYNTGQVILAVDNLY